MKLKKVISLFFIILFLLTLIPSVSAAPLSLVTNDLHIKCASPEGCDLCEFVDLFVNGAGIMVALSGTFSILMFVFGGITIITAYGNEARFKWGKDAIIATIVGICIVLFAWTLINLIIGAMFGNSNFNWANTNGVCSEGGLSSEQEEQLRSLGPL